VKTLWYILAFGISVSLHASLLFFGTPMHSAQIPEQQGHATLMVNLVASVDSQSEQRQTQSQPTPPQQMITTEMAESILAEDVQHAAPVIDPADADLPAMAEPVMRDVQTQRSPTTLPQATQDVVIKHNVAMIDVTDAPINEPTPVAVDKPIVEPSVKSVQSNSDMQPKGVTTQAQLADPIKPVYPMLSRRRGEEGVVYVKVEVTASGHARSVVVTQTSGHRRLDAAAIAACQKVHYIPAIEQGRPVDSVFAFEVVFRLQSDS
jgi:protein TonB